MNNNIKIRYKNLFFLYCIIIIFLLLSLIIFSINNNHHLFKYLAKFWETDYDPLDLINQNKEKGNGNNKSYIKIINYRAPIFETTIWHKIGKGLNIWSNQFNCYNLFLNEVEENVFERDEYAKKINEMEHFIYNENIPTNKAFLKHHFMNGEIMNKIIYHEGMNKTNKATQIIPNDVSLKFPERASRMNKLEYTLNNFTYNTYYIGKFPFNNHWITQAEAFSNNYLTGVSTLQNNYQHLFIEFENKSKFQKINEIENYFKYYNEKFTAYIQEKYKNKNLIYHVTKAQINHLMQLNYQEIQYILHLIEDTTYYKNRTFMDVHWELFSGHNPVSVEKIDTNKKTALSALNNNFHFISLNNLLIPENKTINFLNPFAMNFPGIIEVPKMQKKYYFNEEILRLLPIHILIKMNDHIINDQMFVANIYEQLRSNNFWNLLSNSGNTFIERLFKYTEYGKYSPTTIYFFSNNIEHIETPYEKNFFLSHNPWWDSLTPSTREKMDILFQLEEKDLNDVFLKLINHFFEDKPFLSEKEIEALLPVFGPELDPNYDKLQLPDGTIFPKAPKPFKSYWKPLELALLRRFP